MLQQFNLKWDKRTAVNLAFLPIILFVRVPAILLLWFLEFATKWWDRFCEILPGWRTY